MMGKCCTSDALERIAVARVRNEKVLVTVRTWRELGWPGTGPLAAAAHDFDQWGNPVFPFCSSYPPSNDPCTTYHFVAIPM